MVVAVEAHYVDRDIALHVVENCRQIVYIVFKQTFCLYSVIYLFSQFFFKLYVACSVEDEINAFG